jgi:methylthioribose-1-phosphate isomerase
VYELNIYLFFQILLAFIAINYTSFLGLIADSAAASAMAHFSVDAILVGW